MKKNNYIIYNILASIIAFFGDISFGGRAEGKENIPKNGGCILAGNHTSNFDSYLLHCGTKRPIHYLGKKELFEGPFKWFFKIMHVIPVDRKNKNPEAVNEAVDALKDGKVVGIFPEGTYHKERLLLPFKPGAINFAEKSGMPIIPFAIENKWHFRSRPRIVFGKPINVGEIKEEDKVKYLEKTIENMLIELNKKD